MNADGSEVKQLTEGPFHDFDSVCLPDGGLAFHTTRCKARFLCCARRRMCCIEWTPTEEYSAAFPRQFE